MARNEFIDVATGESYVWEIAHNEVPAAPRRRLIEQVRPTAAGWKNTYPIQIQGSETHQVHRLEGLVATQSQHEAFLRFWRVCAERTVHFLPCTGERYEVVVRSYAPTRKRVVSGPRGAKLHTWTYTLEMEIVALLA